MTTRADYHSETAGVFLAKAGGYLAEDDLLQASEKGWGRRRRWSRRWLRRGAGRTRVTGILARCRSVGWRAGERESLTGFSVASVLHVNFYDGLMSRGAVEDGIERVGEFVGRLEALLG